MRKSERLSVFFFHWKLDREEPLFLFLCQGNKLSFLNGQQMMSDRIALYSTDEMVWRSYKEGSFRSLNRKNKGSNLGASRLHMGEVGGFMNMTEPEKCVFVSNGKKFFVPKSCIKVIFIESVICHYSYVLYYSHYHLQS